MSPVTSGRLNLTVMAAAYSIFGLSLLFQPHRWQSTPAYRVLLEILPAPAWGGLFLAAGVAMGTAAWQFEARRWLVVAALTPAIALTAGWMLAFIVRFLTPNSDTTPETWVSWAVFGLLLLRAAAGLDRPRDIRREAPDVDVFRQAVSDALAAADSDRKTAVSVALDAEARMLSAAVAAACDAYGQALAAVVPAGAMPPGDPARLALNEARSALQRAEEAYGRATGQPP